MKKYIITYDLKALNWNYAGFFTVLKNIGPWWHYLDSTWIIKTNYSSQEIYSKLGPHLSTKDLILITEIVHSDRYGWLPKDAWEWIDN